VLITLSADNEELPSFLCRLTPPPESRRIRLAQLRTVPSAPPSGFYLGALTTLPLVAVNQENGLNHGACNAGPRRLPCRRLRGATHR